jgi:hypothetical protein
MVEHVNSEVDVVLVGIAGDGLVEVDGMAHLLRSGQAVIIPKGVRRAIRSTSGRFAYLTCHRRRTGLWPHRLPHPAGDQGEKVRRRDRRTHGGESLVRKGPYGPLEKGHSPLMTGQTRDVR